MIQTLIWSKNITLKSVLILSEENNLQELLLRHTGTTALESSELFREELLKPLSQKDHPIRQQIITVKNFDQILSLIKTAEKSEFPNLANYNTEEKKLVLLEFFLNTEFTFIKFYRNLETLFNSIPSSSGESSHKLIIKLLFTDKSILSYILNFKKKFIEKFESIFTPSLNRNKELIACIKDYSKLRNNMDALLKVSFFEYKNKKYIKINNIKCESFLEIKSISGFNACISFNICWAYFILFNKVWQIRSRIEFKKDEFKTVLKEGDEETFFYENSRGGYRGNEIIKDFRKWNNDMNKKGVSDKVKYKSGLTNREYDMITTELMDGIRNYLASKNRK